MHINNGQKINLKSYQSALFIMLIMAPFLSEVKADEPYPNISEVHAALEHMVLGTNSFPLEPSEIQVHDVSVERCTEGLSNSSHYVTCDVEFSITMKPQNGDDSETLTMNEKMVFIKGTYSWILRST